jgi:hypothetical protein
MSETHVVANVNTQYGDEEVTSDETITYSVVETPAGSMMERERIETHRNSTTLGEEDITETFDPPELFRPFTRACRDQTWSTFTSIWKTTVDGDGTTTEVYIWDGEVLAIDEQYTNDAGTFTAVHWKASRTAGDNEGFSTERRYDVETGILLFREDVAIVDEVPIIVHHQDFTGAGK